MRITQTELSAQVHKTNRQLRTRELLLQHSQDADLIVLYVNILYNYCCDCVRTMPVPRRGQCSDALYMCWMEMLSRCMPPMLLLRGNQQSVLTFYS